MQKPLYDKEIFPHWCTQQVRYRDLDPLNHVNNAIFSTYYENARIAFIRDMPALSNSLNNGFSFVLASLKIDFIKPVKYPAELLIGSGIKKLGNTSITSFQAIYHQQSKNLISVAETSGVWFDLHHKKPVRLPEINNVEDLMVI